MNRGGGVPHSHADDDDSLALGPSGSGDSAGMSPGSEGYRRTGLTCRRADAATTEPVTCWGHASRPGLAFPRLAAPARGRPARCGAGTGPSRCAASRDPGTLTCGSTGRPVRVAYFPAAGGVRAERWKFSHRPLPAARNARPPMTSSPMLAAARSQYLLDLLAQVPDPRRRRGRRYPLAALLAVGIAAVVAGSRSFAAIGQWAADAGPEVPRPGGGVHVPERVRPGQRRRA